MRNSLIPSIPCGQQLYSTSTPRHGSLRWLRSARFALPPFPLSSGAQWSQEP